MSSGQAWLSTSTDGSSWGNEILISGNNNGVSQTYSYPSVAMNHQSAYIVWQGTHNGTGGSDPNEIYIYGRSYNISTGTLGSIEQIASFSPSTQNFVATPVVDGEIYPAYSTDVHRVLWCETDGLYTRLYDLSGGWQSTAKITGTDSYSQNPSIVDYNGSGDCISWAESNSETIKYMLYPSPGTVEQVSPSGWSQDVRPQITMVYSKPTVVWTSYNNVSEGVSVHERQRSGTGSTDTWGSVTSYSMGGSSTVSAVVGSVAGQTHIELLWNYSGYIYRAYYNGSSWSSASILYSGSNGGDYLSVNQNADGGTLALWTKPSDGLKFDLTYGNLDPKIVASNNSNTPAVRHTRHAIIELPKLVSQDKSANGYIAAEISWMKLNNNGAETDINFSHEDSSNASLSSTNFVVGDGTTTLSFGGAVYGSNINVGSSVLKSLAANIAEVSVKDANTGETLKNIWTSSSSMFDGIRDSSFGQFRNTSVDLSSLAGKDVYVDFSFPLLGNRAIKPIIVDDYIIETDSSNSGNNNIASFGQQIPKQYALSQNYPNPFNPSTTIEYDLPIASYVSLKLYNSLGQEVRTLVEDNEGPGYHYVTLNMNNYSSGIYFYRISAGNFNDVKKLILMK
jgi:Secretion system C-terminal sorting domain